MTSEQWILSLLGSTAVGSIVTAFLTRKSTTEKNKQDNNVELWDRTYKLIEKLETQVANQELTIKTLRSQLVSEEAENEELRQTIYKLERNVIELKREISLAKKGMY